MVIDHGSSSFAPSPAGARDETAGLSPFDLIHGEPLVSCAAWGLGEAGVLLLDSSLTWQQVVELEGPFVLHDPFCPMTPPAFIAECAELAESTGEIVVGVRPVTDTIKRVETGSDGLSRLGEGLDRETVWSLAAPVAIPAAVVAELTDYPGPSLSAFVDWARRAGRPIRYLPGPPECRRVHDRAELAVLAALTHQDQTA